jgi:hypothetical protein
MLRKNSNARHCERRETISPFLKSELEIAASLALLAMTHKKTFFRNLREPFQFKNLDPRAVRLGP